MATETINIQKTNTPILDAEIIDVSSAEPQAMDEKSKNSLRIINSNGEVDLALVSAEQREKYAQLSKNLSTKDINSVTNYGSELQGVMGRQQSRLLSTVRTSKSGEVGELITSLLNELDKVDIDEIKSPNTLVKILRKIPILNLFVSSAKGIERKYNMVGKNVAEVADKIDRTSMSAQEDNNSLQVMFDNTVQYIKNLEELIIAGKLKLEDVKAQLNRMLVNRNDYQPHEIRDIEEFAHNLDRRLTDMLTMRFAMVQSLSQIRAIQYNNVAIANKAQTINSTTIPLWYGQLTMAIALKNQASNIEAQRKVVDTTNELLKRNAEMLHDNSVAVAKETERSVIDVETLQHTTQKLIETIMEVKQVHEEGIAKRKEAERTILSLGTDLDKSLVALQSNSSKYLTYNS